MARQFGGKRCKRSAPPSQFPDMETPVVALMWTLLAAWVAMTLLVWLTLGDDSVVTFWGAMIYSAMMAPYVVLGTWLLIYRASGRG